VKKAIRWLCFLLCLILALNAGTIARLIYPLRHEDIIYEQAGKYNLDPDLLMGVIKTESNFNEHALSHKNASGLMQIIEPTALWLADKMDLTNFSYESICDPELNISMGSYYVSYLLDRYEDNIKTALAAYNAGMGNVDAWLADTSLSEDGINLKNIPFPETKRYVTKVINSQRMYELLYGDNK